MRQKLGEGSKPGYDARVAAGLGRGPNLRKKALAAAWSNTWPAPGATLDLDFANDRGFVRGVGQGSSMQAVTFTRASSANWVDSAGVLRTGAGSFPGTANALGNNLLTFPQDFDNAAWTKGETNIVANCIIAPDGISTADKLAENATNARHFVRQGGFNPVALTTYTLSVYAKAGERRYVQLSLNDNSTGKVGSFDLQTGTLGAVQDTGVTRTITDVGNGWYRCTVTYTMSSSPSTNQNNDIYVTATDVRVETYAGNGTSGIYIWGAQLEVGSSATTYYPTNINVPRFDWASTAQLPRNMVTNTDVLTSAAGWTVSSSTLVAGATDPLGGATAYTLTATGAGGYFLKASNITVSGTTYTNSIYVRRVSGTGTVTLYRNVGEETTIVPTGTWARFSNTWAATSTNGYIGIKLATSGDVVEVWGPQQEIGSTATTYQAQGAYLAANTPLAANPTCNGLLIEESRANRLLWCRDGLNGGTIAGTNMIRSSETLDGNWTQTGVTVSGSTVTATATTGNHRISQNNASYASGVYTFWVEASAGTHSYIQLFNGGDTALFANFDLTAGTVGTVGSQTQASIVNLGGGVYRCIATWGASGNSNNLIGIMPASNSGWGTQWTAVGTETFSFYKCLLIAGATATDYQVTTAAVYGWSKSNVTVAKNQTGVDGVANSATSITATAANGVLIQPISLASGSRTCSVYLKRITGTGNVQVTLDGSTWSTVDLSNGIWNRIVLSGTVTNPTVGIRLATNGDAVAMDYGQIEDGAFATSPILTTTASVTRSVDFCSCATNAWMLDQGRAIGTFASVFDSYATVADVIDPSGSANQYIAIGSKNTIRGCADGVTPAITVTSSSIDVLTKTSAASCYSYNKGALAANGSFYSERNSFVPTPQSIVVFGSRSTSLNVLNGRISRIIFIPKKLEQSALVNLSASILK